MENHTVRQAEAGNGSESAIELKQIKKRVQATDADMSGSTFTDVSLSGIRIRQDDLTGASIVESLTAGLPMAGITVADLMATDRATQSKDK